MQKISSLLIFLIFTLLSCSSGPQQGIIKNENGVVIKEFSYIGDSILHGPYKTYGDNGIMFEEAAYVDGKLEGERTLFYENGETEISENYVSGELNGPYISYYPDGKKNVVANFKDGVMMGVVKRYYESGGLMEEVNFANNEENGPFKEYYENGKIKWEGEYLNGDNEFGLLIHFNEEGSIIKKMQCDSNAICQTIWTPEKGDIPLKIILENN